MMFMAVKIGPPESPSWQITRKDDDDFLTKHHIILHRHNDQIKPSVSTMSGASMADNLQRRQAKVTAMPQFNQGTR
jgi:hypothetical protein